ncbi:MAG: hypothetical protein AAFQ89_10810 [Cyanobacteria bacterium J06626_18]
MSQTIQYITDEAGQRGGVLLDLDTYERLRAKEEDPDLLINLDREELIALAESTLSPETQSQLSDLLAQNAENKISEVDRVQLDQLLTRVDHLDILKTRAHYTLHHLSHAKNAQ